MRYTKKQKEIIAYCLSLLESDCEVEGTRNDMITIIQDLQSQRIFGYINYYLTDEN
jgi:hypothetical protein|tara:strand:- start:944 stop:1111 length:168 start_codon:yes stop_codon:yes gene_type:complete